MKEKIVKTQAELDEAVNFDGLVIIKFGTPYNRAIVKRAYKYPVVAWENSSVEARGNSSVAAWENSSVEAWENSSVVARGNSSVVAWENSSVVAWENSSVAAWEKSSVVAWENSSVVARGNSSVVAWGNSSVEAWENSSVAAWENSSVEAWENVQICDRTIAHTLTVGGNARIVYDPRDIKEYIDFYGLKETEETVFLFKAVHKRDGKYVSDYDSEFEYTIGAEAEANGIATDIAIECGRGIHMAYAEWCVAYGKGWGDLAILELEVEKSSVIVPLGGSGKVRALKVKVVREVPLAECGLLGKRLAKRRDNG